MTVRYRKHALDIETRDDGTLLLRSGLQLGPVAENTGAWLHHWAREAPDRVFLAEREGDGWRELTFAEALRLVRAVASGLMRQGVGPGQGIVVLSGPSINHGILALATQYIGAYLVPLAEQYALIRDAHSRLIHAVEKTRPKMVFAEDGDQFALALALPLFGKMSKVATRGGGPEVLAFADLIEARDAPNLDTLHAQVGPDTLAKILFTSGSTSMPKGVPQTHRMMCVNQAQYQAVLPFLSDHPPVMLDWMPWNHVFGGSSDFNMALANGGSLYLDDGKPLKGRFERTLENNRMISATLSLNVPIAYAMLVQEMRRDEALKRQFFTGLDMIFYAGASLPRDVWQALEDMSREVTGTIPMMTSSWGMTETAPMAIIHYQGGAETGHIGVPSPGLEAKLIPEQPGRYELRVRGPNVMTGYFEDPAKTAETFDDEGFLITHDAVRFVDETDRAKGVKFDGRTSEDFKLQSGTFVQAGNLRLEALAALSGLAQDVVVTGEGKADVGLFIFPPAALGLSGAGDGTVQDPAYLAQVTQRLTDLASKATGSSNRIARFLVLEEPPSVGDGEITAKGSLNTKAILTRREGLLDRLYDGGNAGVVEV